MTESRNYIVTSHRNNYRVAMAGDRVLCIWRQNWRGRDVGAAINPDGPTGRKVVALVREHLQGNA